MRTHNAMTIFVCAALAVAAPQTQPPADPAGPQSVTAEAPQDKPKGKEVKPPTAAEVKAWDECDEYISASPCKVTINLGNTELPADPHHNQYGTLKPRAHWDVQVKPFQKLRNTERLGNAAVLLVKKLAVPLLHR